MKKSHLLIGAALTSLALAGSAGANKPAKEAKAGECHGMNSCKGQGDCGNKQHGCGGQNACKGKGWKKMTEAQCKAKKGKWQPMTMEM